MLSKSVNQNSNIWFINCKINCSSIRSHSKSYNSLIVFLFEFAFQQFNESTFIYLFTYLLDNFFNNCTSILLIIVREKFWNTRVCKSNSRVLFNFVRNRFSIRSSAFYSLFLLDNFLQNLHEHLYVNSRYLTKSYVFARQIDTFFSVSFRKLFNFSISFRSSWVFLRNFLRKQLSFVRRNRRLQNTKKW